MKSLREIAAQWHDRYDRQESALYAYASTGTIQAGLAREIAECTPLAKTNRERAELTRLHAATAPALTIADIIENNEFWHRKAIDYQGYPIKCRKNGQIKLWKTRPNDFRQPVKYGFRDCFCMLPSTMSQWCLPL